MPANPQAPSDDVRPFHGTDPVIAAEYRYFSLGRHALRAGLSALGVGKGDLVLVPAFICRDLLAAVHAVQAEALFYPVDEHLAPHSLPVDHRVKAVLSVNYFGFPQALDLLRDYCTRSGAALIEDNAHGFLSRDEHQVLLGTRGDLGLLSLHKTFSWPDGAVLLVNQKSPGLKLPIALPCRYDRLPMSFTVKRALGGIQNATGVRVRSASEKVARFFRAVRTGHALPVSLAESEFEISGDPAIHCASLRMLEKMDSTSEINRRRALYQRFHRELAGWGIAPIFGNLPDGVCPYGYPFRANAGRAAAVAALAQRRGFDCSSWPDLPSAVVDNAPGFYRDVWWINFLC
jgi:hypothetical protein